MARMSRNSPAAASLAGLVDDLRRDGRLGQQIVHAAYLPAQAARHRELDQLDPPLPEALAQALRRGGVPRLWSHQAEGLAAVGRRQDVLITTPTASGKSLVFQLPALAEAVNGGPGRGLSARISAPSCCAWPPTPGSTPPGQVARSTTATRRRPGARRSASTCRGC